MSIDIKHEVHRTQPDYNVYVPGSVDGSTHDTDNDVLWHPDRKFFLLGKHITREWLADLAVPSA